MSRLSGTPHGVSFTLPEGKGEPGAHHATLGFLLHDQEEDMKRWDNVPTSNLEAHIYELQGRPLLRSIHPRRLTLQLPPR